MKSALGLRPADLPEEINEKSKIAPVEIVERKTKNTQHASHSYFVSFQNKANLNKIRNIMGLNNLRVKWEQYS